MDVMGLDNDTRGWIMALVSGVACVLGASVICIDKLVRLFPGKKNFRIQDSNAFLASSLSLSFGVMIFMSLYSMLPEAKNYLKGGGFDEQAAGFVLIGTFVGGFVGIQVISRICHRFLPSHVVDCDHSHEELPEDSDAQENGNDSSPLSRMGSVDKHRHHQHHHHDQNGNRTNDSATESTPLLSTRSDDEQLAVVKRPTLSGNGSAAPFGRNKAPERRSSMAKISKKVTSFVADSKANCAESGSCHGYSDPCGQECFKHLSARSSFSISRRPTLQPIFMRTTTGVSNRHPLETVNRNDDDEVPPSPRRQRRTSRARSRDQFSNQHEHHHDHSDGENHDQPVVQDTASEDAVDLEAQHHHHVPENAFLSIGLQTSIAIALHKFPEGFITYATNHANPDLGFNVFLALFVHNISEGFAMALPLYMALNNRLKAMVWSFVLGGLSQPLGAGIAVLWFKLAKHTNMTPNEVAYGCLFGVTAGIMASVALQLFVESLTLNHNRNLSILFAFIGMTLLGLSSAFTSHAH